MLATAVKANSFTQNETRHLTTSTERTLWIGKIFTKNKIRTSLVLMTSIIFERKKNGKPATKTSNGLIVGSIMLPTARRNSELNNIEYIINKKCYMEILEQQLKNKMF